MTTCTDNRRCLTPDLPVIVILGTTATGKTSLALSLAKRFPVEIINADSRYLYRGMDIGTAKPTIAERKRTAHHLIDVLRPIETYSLARYLDDAFAAIEDVGRRGQLPVVAGGTPLYLRALIEGWTVPRVQPDESLRTELEKLTSDDLFCQVEQIDPVSAQRIGPANRRRLIRALEIFQVSGQRMSDVEGKVPPPYNFLLIGLRLEREALYKRIDERAAWMYENGILDEARDLLDFDPGLPALSAIGYPEARAVLSGELSVVKAIEKTSFATHRYVRHQETWFRKFTNVHWFNSSDGNLTYDVQHLVASHTAG